MNELNHRISILLSLQRALLGAISPSIRAVTSGWDNENISIKFICDTQPTETDLEDFSGVESEIMADFPEMNVCTKWKVVSVNESINSEILVAWIYRRKEIEKIEANPL